MNLSLCLSMSGWFMFNDWQHDPSVRETAAIMLLGWQIFLLLHTCTVHTWQHVSQCQTTSKLVKLDR